MTAGRVLAVVVALCAAFLSAPAASSPGLAAPPAVGPDERPNILLITTDDQAATDLRVMPQTRRLIASQGITFTGISPHPLCCPARAQIMTGQYAHNNGVLSNAGENGGYDAFDPSSTLATWLHGAGYQTAFIGKFLNGLSLESPGDPTQGWDEWHPTVDGIYDYWDFTIDHNGAPQNYADSYQTDVFSALGVKTIEDFASDPRPFFLWQSFLAPHTSCRPDKEPTCWGPPDPADRHRRMFPHALPASFDDPSYDEADVRDKPRWVRAHRRMTVDQELALVREHRARLRALQAVDEGVARMVGALAKSGRLDNTLIVFTSDNGFMLGEHRLHGKNDPYEPALRVPFLMRGPDVPTGVVSSKLAAIVDIAPTFMAAAGARAGLRMDGRNLLPIARGVRSGWGDLLIQAGAREPGTGSDWFFRGVRTPRYTYVAYPVTRERELYDRKSDPHQLVNRAMDPRYRAARIELAQRLGVLGQCAGATCRQRFGKVPSPTAWRR